MKYIVLGISAVVFIAIASGIQSKNEEIAECVKHFAPNETDPEELRLWEIACRHDVENGNFD